MIVGGGAAAANEAVGIRELNPEGSVLIVGQEKWWPYDRPPLSKGLIKGTMTAEDAESKDPSWYEKNNVQVRRGTKAISVDRGAKTVGLDDGSTIGYGKLLLATGSLPNRLPLPGIDLAGVHLFRTADDSLAVKAAAVSGERAILIGTGYIGLEVASSLLTHGVKSILIDPAPHPWSRLGSPTVGDFLKGVYEAAGFEFRLGQEPVKLLGENAVEGVVLKSGEQIAGKLVVIGAGVSLNVALAKACGLEADEKEGVAADPHLRTSDPDIYVAGDIACVEDAAMGKSWHAEHQLNAKWQGKQAGRNMAGAGEKYERVPYFFSDFLDLHFILRGYPGAGTSFGVLGDVASGEFVELYARPDGTLAMATGMSRDEPKLDKISDRLEALVQERAVVKGLGRGHGRAVGILDFGSVPSGDLFTRLCVMISRKISLLL